MPNPIRCFEPERIYFVTNRTLQGRLLMTPSPRLNGLIGGVLARAVQLHDVELFAFVFLSNHFHLLLRASEGEFSKFMGYLQGNIAREVGRQHDWHGKFWHRRFSAEPVLDEDALSDRLAYIFSHGVKEGLVDHSRQWPGLTCIPELVDGRQRRFGWVDRTAMFKLRRRGLVANERDHTEQLVLRVSALPCWRERRRAERCRQARDLMLSAERRAREQRDQRPAAGACAVRRKDPHSRPAYSHHRPRPHCHCSSRLARCEFLAARQEFTRRYRSASRLFRAGQLSVEFPRYSYRPPLPYDFLIRT